MRPKALFLITVPATAANFYLVPARSKAEARRVFADWPNHRKNEVRFIDSEPGDEDMRPSSWDVKEQP